MENQATFEALKAAALKDISAYTDNIAKTKYSDLQDSAKRTTLITSYANATQSAAAFRQFIQNDLAKQLNKSL